MFYERRRSRSGRGGKSIHHLWPLELHLRWDADWELRYGPPTFELGGLAAIILGLVAFVLP